MIHKVQNTIPDIKVLANNGNYSCDNLWRWRWGTFIMSKLPKWSIFYINDWIGHCKARFLKKEYPTEGFLRYPSFVIDCCIRSVYLGQGKWLSRWLNNSVTIVKLLSIPTRIGNPQAQVSNLQACLGHN